MRSMILQDWLTIRGNPSVASLTQSESDWLDVSQYQDVTFWLVFRELTFSAASSVTLNYQTGPEKDDRLFATIASEPLNTLSVSSVVTTDVISSRFTSSMSIALGA